MSAYRFVTITCDTCGEIWDHGTFTVITQARRDARLNFRWSRDGKDDLCARCTAFGRPWSNPRETNEAPARP